MGVVYRAVDPDLRRGVAIKVLHPACEEADRGRLIREARALGRASHRNVVSVFDSGISDGRMYVVMELCRGTTLKHWLADERRSTREVIDVFCQAGDGLAAIHRAGIIIETSSRTMSCVVATARSVSWTSVSPEKYPMTHVSLANRVLSMKISPPRP